MPLWCCSDDGAKDRGVVEECDAGTANFVSDESGGGLFAPAQPVLLGREQSHTHTPAAAAVPALKEAISISFNVVGAGMQEFNGGYVLCGSDGGKPQYELAGHENPPRVYHHGSRDLWCMWNRIGDKFQYESVEHGPDPTKPPTGGWKRTVAGQDPAPQIAHKAQGVLDNASMGESMDEIAKGPTFYGVAYPTVCVYTTWDDCMAACIGVKGAKFKIFPTEAEALSWAQENSAKIAEKMAAMVSPEENFSMGHIGRLLEKVGPGTPVEYTIMVTKAVGEVFGLSFDDMVDMAVVTEVKKEGVIAKHNQTAAPADQVAAGDRLLEVNGKGGNLKELVGEMGKSDKLSIKFRRAQTWEIQVDKAKGLGLTLAHKKASAALFVGDVNAGAIKTWNEANPQAAVMKGDRIISANGQTGAASGVIAGIQSATGMLTLQFAR